MAIELEYGCGCSSEAYQTPVYKGDRPQIITGDFAVASGLTATVSQWFYQDGTDGFKEIKSNTSMTGKKPVLLVGIYDRNTKQNYGTASIDAAADVAAIFGQFWANKGNTQFPCLDTLIRDNATGLLVSFDPAVQTNLAGALDIIYNTLPDGSLEAYAAIA